MRLKEEINRVKGLMKVLVEWNVQTVCAPLYSLGLDWYANKEFEDGKFWVADEDNHKDLACQTKRYKEYQKWLKDNGKDPNDYKIELAEPEIEDEIEDETEDETEDDLTPPTSDCMDFTDWLHPDTTISNIYPWDNGILKRENRFIPLNICKNNDDKYYTTKQKASDATGDNVNKFEVVICYECEPANKGTNTEYIYRNYYKYKVETEKKEDCSDYVIFSTNEGPTASPDDDIEVCKTTDARLLEQYLGIEPYDLLSTVNQDKIYSLTKKYGNDIYNECIKESPYWSGKDTEFQVRKFCIPKYKDLLKQVMPSSSNDDDEDVVSGLSELLEPFNAVATMCLDQGCNEVVSVYNGEPQNYINTEIESWSEGSPERIKSMNKRFYSKKKAVDSWLKGYLDKKLASNLDLKNFPFIGDPENWPGQNVIDIIENSIALLLTNPTSLKSIGTIGKAYIEIKNATPKLNGTYKVVFDQGTLLPKYIMFVHTKADICPRLQKVAQQNGYTSVSLNEYNEKISELGSEEQKFVNNLSRYIKGYGCEDEIQYFLPIE